MTRSAAVRLRRKLNRIKREVRCAGSSLASGWLERQPWRDVLVNRRGQIAWDGKRMDFAIGFLRKHGIS